jgi:uncharacterized MAPEG superfamily protein
VSTEIFLLAGSIVLGFVHIVLASHAASWQRGYRWTAGPRDDNVPLLTGVAGRLARASQNFLETFPFFAAAILAAHVTGREGVLTLWGAQLYVWARLVYLPLYAFGVPLARSLTWNVAAVGIFLIVAALFV